MFNPDEADHPALKPYRAAHYYFVIGNYERAAAEFSHAIQLLPDFSYAYVARGDCYAMLRLYDRAIADYTQALALYPDQARVFYKRGLAYDAQGETSSALADFRRAAELDPGYAYLYRQIAGASR
jgi:tetratricopeptide (TPR) repeat protein